MSDATPNSDTVVSLSQTGQRMYPRIEMPLRVELLGQQYETTDWSLGGFGLGDGAPCLELGSVQTAELLLSFPCFESRMSVMVKVVRVEEGEGRGFQFIDMTSQRAEILSYIIDRHLSGETILMPEMMEMGEVGRIVFSQKSTQRLQTLSSALRLSLVVAGVLIFATIGLSIIVSSFLTVRSEYASVASSRTLIRAPFSGFVEGAEIDPQSPVERGALLFTISPPVKPQAIVSLEQDIVLMQQRIDILQSELSDAELAFDAWRSKLSVQKEATEAQVVYLSQTVDANQRVYDRLQKLREQGIATALRLDEAEVRLRQSQNELSAKQSALKTINFELDAAKQGLYVDNADKTRKSPNELRREISESKNLLSGKQVTLNSLEEQFVVRSPCHCLVETTSIKLGEFVERGDIVYTLGDANQSVAEVDALVPISRVKFLRKGAAAQVVLADSTEEIIGHVTDVNYNPMNTGRTGLPDQLRTMGRYALVTIALQSSEQTPLSGLPAVATMRISLGDLLFYYLGLS